jgi:hypothetical protein
MQMRKSRLFALVGFSLAAGVVLVVVFMPLLSREPMFAMAATAKLTIQNAFSTFTVARKTTNPRGPAANNVRDLAETLSFDGPPPKRRAQFMVD